MNGSPQTFGPESPGDLERAMSSFTEISESLVRGYGELAERAERVEQELCRANEALEAILRALPTGVVVRDSSGRISRVNDAALEILGTSAGDVLGQAEAGPLSSARADGIPREFIGRDQRRIVLSTRNSPILDAGGAVTGSVQILDDRTEVTALAERLHAIDKIAALGTMAGGIAHEIRNPLNASMGFAALLQRELSSDTKAHHWASRIVDGCREADAIIASMMSLANPEGLHRESLDGQELLESAAAAAMLEATGASDTSATTPWKLELSCTAPLFQGDRIKLRQALRNLIANAAAAMPEGGVIRGEVVLREDDILLRVSDSGHGVPPEARSQLFDPFFTTRAEGTGLGLALVAAIARVHGGCAELVPGASPLGGAEFQLRLPYLPIS